MKQAIYEMIEKGQLAKLKNKWAYETNSNCTPERKGKPLSFYKLVTLFMIPIIGLILALLILVMENVFGQKCTNHDLKKEVTKQRLKACFNELKEIRSTNADSDLISMLQEIKGTM